MDGVHGNGENKGTGAVTDKRIPLIREGMCMESMGSQ